MAFLLDTNAWIHYLKNPASPIRQRLVTVKPTDVVLCSVVKAELLHGAQKYGRRKRRLAVLAKLFAPYVSVPFDDAAASAYGRIRHDLESAGRVIGPFDLQIAAICVAHGFTLVTSNTSEFSRVSKLAFEDWLTS
jgi:tRNA(fMet)-specific endonuclease VapC